MVLVGFRGKGMVEKMVLEVVIGKKVEWWSQGGRRLEEGEFLSLFYLNIIVVRDRFEGLLVVLFFFFFLGNKLFYYIVGELELVGSRGVGGSVMLVSFGEFGEDVVDLILCVRLCQVRLRFVFGVKGIEGRSQIINFIFFIYFYGIK